MNIQQAIAQVVEREDLNEAQMQTVMRDIMSGSATEAQIAGFLIALRMKGETVAEIAAAATVMRDFAEQVDIEHEHLVDIVGTGGDGSHTFNISTTAAFVIAAAGGQVAKHNNRSVSSRSGSADVLELAGVKMGLQPNNVAHCIRETGVGFMFAPAHHPAMRHAITPRRELATRSIFNLLGPLTNPARVRRQLVGVYDRQLTRPIAEVLQRLGSVHALVVCSDDGMDEISISANTQVAELRDDSIDEYQIKPAQFGLQAADKGALVVESAEQSYAVMQSVLNNEPGPCRDAVVLNAGAAIYVAGIATDIKAGVALAEAALADGGAGDRLQRLVELSNTLD
ncbi:MAG: anthranilate phosphoribosyltransferase [Gammaproteobacteria bacterium]